MLWNTLKTNKHPDENLDLPMDLTKNIRLLSNVCDSQKEIYEFGKENHRLGLGVYWKSTG